MSIIFFIFFLLLVVSWSLLLHLIGDESYLNERMNSCKGKEKKARRKSDGGRREKTGGLEMEREISKCKGGGHNKTFIAASKHIHPRPSYPLSTRLIPNSLFSEEGFVKT